METEDLHKAFGAFIIALGSTLPASLAERIRQQALQISSEMIANGEPTVARLTKEYGEAVMASHLPPDSTH